jgi:beta-amylase
MLGLDTMNNDGSLRHPSQLRSNLQQLARGGVDGVMVDVWWGIVEAQGPRVYNWTGYLELADMARSANLTLQVVASFHSCGGNVGDTTCSIPLPSWVLSVGKSNPDIFYRDGYGGIDTEYISLGADNEAIFGGRSPLQIYHDFFVAFNKAFSSYMPHVINEVQVGMGPAGELRYPGYQSDRWQYCGIGGFQSYDKYMLKSLADAASNAGHPEWGTTGPNNAGGYNARPGETGFFSNNGGDNYASGYGEFFLSWYSQQLLKHGQNILSLARKVWSSSSGVGIAGKISGIHWWYSSDSHAAEATSGYFNTDNHNAYQTIASMFKSLDVAFDFTCLEMVTQPNNCGSDPENLVKQTRQATNDLGVHYAGENALELCNPQCYEGGFNQILKQSTQYGPILRFTYLRISDNLLSSQYNNWGIFTNFVQKMRNAG